MARVGALHIEYTAATAKFEAAARRVKQSLSSQGAVVKALRKRLRKLRYSVKRAVSSFGGFKAATIAITATAYAIKQLADAGKDLDHLSRRINISTHDLQLMFRVFERDGVQIQETTDALAEFQKRLSEAELGTGEAIYALQKLGLTLDDFKGKTVVDQIALIADGVKNLDDQAGRLFVLDKMFGGVGMRMASTLQEGGEAIRNTAAEMEKLGTLTEGEVARLTQISNAISDAFTAIKVVVQKTIAAIVGLTEAVAKFIAKGHIVSKLCWKVGKFFGAA